MGTTAALPLCIVHCKIVISSVCRPCDLAPDTQLLRVYAVKGAVRTSGMCTCMAILDFVRTSRRCPVALLWLLLLVWRRRPSILLWLLLLLRLLLSICRLEAGTALLIAWLIPAAWLCLALVAACTQRAQSQ